VLLRLRRPWRDRTRAIRFEPTELREKLAAMIPRPRANLLIYHGAFAPRGCCREGPVRWPPEGTQSGATEGAAPPTDLSLAQPTGGSPPANLDGGTPAAPRAPPASGASVRPRHFPWADLLRRTFAIDLLACPNCGGRLRLVATIEDRRVIEQILAHLNLPVDPPSPALARSPEWLPGWSD